MTFSKHDTGTRQLLENLSKIVNSHNRLIVRRTTFPIHSKGYFSLHNQQRVNETNRCFHKFRRIKVSISIHFNCVIGSYWYCSHFMHKNTHSLFTFVSNKNIHKQAFCTPILLRSMLSAVRAFFQRSSI